MLIETSKNFFLGLPSDHRKEFYTHVDAFILDVPSERKPVTLTTTTSSSSSSSSTSGNRKTKMVGEPVVTAERVLLIGLYNENNFLKDFEDLMPSEIFLTRALRKLEISVELDKTFDEIYTESLKYVMFDRKLFGPQEDEIGEECMNPLKYAKMIKQRRSACEDVLKHISSIKLEDLQQQLKAHGLNHTGTRKELTDRVTELFNRQLSIIGFGELSAFGEKSVREIFKKFDVDKDDALSLWEMNAWLYHMGSKTISNMKDYKSIVSSLNLQVNKNGYITIDGIIAYYEIYGRLEEDLRALGVGSLDSILAGDLKVIINFTCIYVYQNIFFIFFGFVC